MSLQERMRKQQGLSIVGLIIILFILGLVAVLAMKVIPVVNEFFSIRSAVYKAREVGGSVQQIKESFRNQSVAGYFTSITAEDLSISQENGQYEVSVAYEKKIPLFGPVSLVFDFETTTAKLNSKAQAASAKE
ncbi:DUF4845 domain-containing protein [Massilia sp. W12]|uniref:DUF4845 domain-containing protein n=1 Tax=Massilia sp. W12 TaxID=3126507 RepID=UPI0030D4C6B5